MTMTVPVLTVLLILALLIVAASPVVQAQWPLLPGDISQLSMPKYANVAMIQTLQAAMKVGLCSPKVLYGPCSYNTAIFGCRITNHSKTWGVLILKLPPNGDPFVYEGMYMSEERFISYATGAPYWCPVRPIVLP